MANDYLVSKWKIWYKSLDVNHDGKISYADVEDSRKQFTDLHKLDTDLKQKTNTNFDIWWDNFIFHGDKSVEISEEQFVADLNSQLKEGKDKFKEKMQACFNMFFDVIDTNQDRSISEDEFLIAFKAYGHENVALDTKFFNGYKPKEGLVPLKDIVTSWVTFATSENSSDDDIVKKNFEAGV